MIHNINTNTIQLAMKYAFVSVSNNSLSYKKHERKQITESMQTVKELAYPSAGRAIEFANPGPVKNLLIIAHDIGRAYEAYETPIP